MAATPSASPTDPVEKPKPLEEHIALTADKVTDAYYSSLQPEADYSLRKNANNLFQQYLNQIISKNSDISKYNILILYDNTRLVRADADRIYSAITKFTDTQKPILLILHSSGGSIGAGYLIGKLCQEYTDKDFVIAVPRQAKSAATLLCCAADEIHMGSMSELGPIDPQIDDLPVLGLKQSIEHIAGLVKQHPESATMFASFLSQSLKLIDLGYYERVAESAVQYAERLLKTHAATLIATPARIANDLVYTYKDHGFVIDKAESIQIFGDKTIKTKTPEYSFANEVYEFMEEIRFVARLQRYSFYFVGSTESFPTFTKNRD